MKCPLFGPKIKKIREDFTIYNMVPHDLHRSPSTVRVVTMAKLNSVLFIYVYLMMLSVAQTI
jgi:hypothetical protein